MIKAIALMMYVIGAIFFWESSEGCDPRMRLIGALVWPVASETIVIGMTDRCGQRIP